MRSWRTLGVAAALLAARAALAHHSPSAYDLATEISIEGTIVKLGWENPHIYFVVETVAADGGKTLHEVEAGPLAAARSLGLDRAAISPGARVTVRANPNRAGPDKIARGVAVMTADGNVYALAERGRARDGAAPSAR